MLRCGLSEVVFAGVPSIRVPDFAIANSSKDPFSVGGLPPPHTPRVCSGGAPPPHTPPKCRPSASVMSAFGLHGPRAPDGPRTKTLLGAIWAPDGFPKNRKTKMGPNGSKMAPFGLKLCPYESKCTPGPFRNPPGPKKPKKIQKNPEKSKKSKKSKNSEIRNPVVSLQPTCKPKQVTSE